MEQKSGRISAIDVARGVAILLVVFAHTLYTGRLRSMIYRFHMPLFFVLSGMVLHAPATAQDLRAAVRKRAYTCLIPYCIWGIFFMPVTPGGLLALLYGSHPALMRSGTAFSLWFLPALFLASVWCEILLFAVRKFPYPRLFLLGAAVLLFAVGLKLPDPLPFDYPFGLLNSFVAAGFMLLGYAALPLLRHLQNPFGGGVGSLVSALGFLAVGREHQGAVDMAIEVYGDAKLFLLSACLGTLAVLGAAAVLDKIPGLGRLLRCVGRHTMGIFVLHMALIGDIAWLTGLFFGPLNSKIPAIAVQSLLNLTACLGLTVLLERYLPFTLGKGSLPRIGRAN